MALTFLDEVGSPLPPGVLITVYNYSTGQQTAYIGQGYTVVGGVVNGITLPADPNATYIARFYGNQAPTVPCAFGPNGLQAYYDKGYHYDAGYNYDSGSPITVGKYRSPFLSQAQYATAGSLLQPLGWYDTAALGQGGVLHALMRGLLAPIAADDASAQQVLESLRFQTCQGTELDTWAYDMLGGLFQRFTGESDADFYGRVLTMISRPRCTINAIQSICNAFYKYIEDQPSSPTAGQLAFDTAGGYNATGAYDTNPPTMRNPLVGTAIYVWDGMTQPGLAATFGVTPLQFVIQVGALVVSQGQLLAFDLVGGFDTSGAFDTNPNVQVLPTPSIIPPDARLGEIIQVIAKAAGTQPLWIYGPSLQE